MSDTPEAAIRSLFAFLDRLDELKAYYRVDHVRNGFVLVEVNTPGCHWEIEFGINGELQIERFRSSGEIEPETALADLWRDLT